ncbi:hypothetical protein B0H13DRAFT_1923083 [Mycena leptocephala]|nr:hypothetical protein B0H13DRAFT_1923083 [Mycena leptocephala]
MRRTSSPKTSNPLNRLGSLLTGASNATTLLFLLSYLEQLDAHDAEQERGYGRGGGYRGDGNGDSDSHNNGGDGSPDSMRELADRLSNPDGRDDELALRFPSWEKKRALGKKDLYREECKNDAAHDSSGLEVDNDPLAELEALHPRHHVLLRRSARLRGEPVVDRVAMDAAVPSSDVNKKRKRNYTSETDAERRSKFARAEAMRKDTGVRNDCWWHKGALVCPAEECGGASLSIASEVDSAAAANDVRIHRATPQLNEAANAAKKLPNGDVNPAHLEKTMLRVLARPDAVSTSTFSMWIHMEEEDAVALLLKSAAQEVTIRTTVMPGNSFNFEYRQAGFEPSDGAVRHNNGAKYLENICA